MATVEANIVDEQILRRLENKLGRGLHLAHLNCQSLANKGDMINAQLTLEGFDLLTLSETWLTDRHPTGMYNIKGYSLIRKDRQYNNEKGKVKKGGGVGMYISNKLTWDDMALSSLDSSDPDAEIIWVLIKFEKQRDIAVASVYRPPGGELGKCCERLEEVCAEAGNGGKRDIFIMGDFNVDYGGTGQQKARLNRMANVVGITQLIKEPTRIVGTHRATLDLIFTNSCCVKTAGTRPWEASDHELVYVTRKKAKENKNTVKKMGRSYANYDKLVYTDKIKSKNWGFMEGDSNIDVKWAKFRGNMEEALDEMCPIKSLTVRASQDKWITKEILTMVSTKANLAFTLKTSHDPKDHQAYRLVRGKLANNVRAARSQYIKQLDNDCRGDPAKFWDNIHEVWPSGKGKERIDSIPLIDEQKEKLTQSEVAEAMNNHFTTIGPDLATKFSRQWENRTQQYQIKIGTTRATNKATIKLIKDIDTAKSTGMAHLSGKVVRDAFEAVPQHLTRMFNESLGQGIVPSEWKKATVVPIHKGGDRGAKGNYRPISLLPTPGKMLEKIVHRHVMEHLEANNLLNENQDGFRKNRSTTGTIARLTDKILKDRNNKKTTAAAFVDFTKAFDTVDHAILLEKLKIKGIHGQTLDWLANYLGERSQQTRIGEVLSQAANIKCGVPQGSVLGPLLFLVYIDDLKEWIAEDSINLFADDTVITDSNRDEGTAIKNLTAKLECLSEWCQVNKTTVNLGKTKVMLFTPGTKNPHKIKPIRMGEASINQVEHYKYLGMVLDSKLTYQKCLADVIKKTSHKIWMLAKTRYLLTRKMALSIYKTMIRPYFDYADVVYMGGRGDQLAKLQRLQNRALKLCLGKEARTPTQAIHEEAKVTTLGDRREQHLLALAYQRAQATEYLKTAPRGTRGSSAPLLSTERGVSQAYGRSVEAMAGKAWNALPAQLRRLPSLEAFKRRVSKQNNGQTTHE